jgi:lipopolysaccharide/colanic/teichoic acid biosynthesis glycosyltransferase
MGMNEARRRAYLSWKRALDVGVSAAVLVAAAPVVAACAVGIRATMGSPVMFRQVRPGRGERLFELLKLRTMRDAMDSRGEPLPDAARLTRMGEVMRRTSLDELPQLWNVLRGDMSLVGPRPLLVEYLPRYSPAERRRHEVQPGITGWAQVNGRNSLSWEEKFALDVWYVDHQSMLLDLRILALTALRVVRRHGIASEGHATMPKFMGSPSRSDGAVVGAA